MTQLTEEQRLRITRIKEQREWRRQHAERFKVNALIAANDDNDFLLSLLDSDSQAAAVMVSDAPARLWVELRTQHAFTVKPDPYMETVEYGTIDSFNQHYENLMRAGLLREQDAATRMRDKCVDELNGLLAEYEEEQRERTEDEGSAHRIVRAAILAMHRAIARVQALTLDQEQDKQRGGEVR